MIGTRPSATRSSASFIDLLNWFSFQLKKARLLSGYFPGYFPVTFRFSGKFAKTREKRAFSVLVHVRGERFRRRRPNWQPGRLDDRRLRIPVTGIFHVMRNTVFSGITTARKAVDSLRRLLPPDWGLRVQRFSERRPDAILELQAPDGGQALIVVEAKSSLEPRDVPRLVAQLRHYVESAQLTGASLLVAAPYLSPRTRELLSKADVGYVDTTGNLRVAIRRPAMFIERSGSDSNPWPDQRPLRSLKGPTAGRVIRALCDFRPPYGVLELAERSATSAASVSRVIDVLNREALLTREPRGRVLDVQWAALIRRWVTDYALLSSNRAQTFLAPRGLPSVISVLVADGARYSVTGSMAAETRAPIAPSPLGMIYVDDTAEIAQILQLRPAETAGNLILLEPFDEVVFERTWTNDGVTFAALSQVAADLLTSPGRGPAEGEELLRWMEANEADWRTA